jgi:hypothetical protein
MQDIKMDAGFRDGEGEEGEEGRRVLKVNGTAHVAMG